MPNASAADHNFPGPPHLFLEATSHYSYPLSNWIISWTLQEVAGDFPTKQSAATSFLF